MAFYSIKHTGGAEALSTRLVALVRREIETIRLAIARRRAFYATVSELTSLSDRDLADIGISRSDIRHIATLEAMKLG